MYSTKDCSWGQFGAPKCPRNGTCCMEKPLREGATGMTTPQARIYTCGPS